MAKTRVLLTELSPLLRMLCSLYRPCRAAYLRLLPLYPTPTNRPACFSPPTCSDGDGEISTPIQLPVAAAGRNHELTDFQLTRGVLFVCTAWLLRACAERGNCRFHGAHQSAASTTRRGQWTLTRAGLQLSEPRTERLLHVVSHGGTGNGT
jgi:hypothetical protein